ncbi:hypothetical protein AB1Y20_010582 [Prymnesium parvum]|uniref:Uncharacterized protein n=1 Tax=Prymnesium parvum TaxID=97485 RepID=A0AB34ISN1_PRYPA
MSADMRMERLAAEMVALSSQVTSTTLRRVNSQLISLRSRHGERGRGALASSHAVTASRRKAMLEGTERDFFHAVRNVPFLFADEHPRRLCAAKPPWGLLSKDASQLGAPANWSRVRLANRTREHMNLCYRYAERLQQNARLGTRPPTPRNQSCAVVGSSGTLSGSGHGRLIDSHQLVMRFNAAPAGGRWAMDVGEKTTLRLFTDKTIAVGAKRNDLRAGGEGLLLYCMATWLRTYLDEYGGRGRLPSAGVIGIAFAISRCSRVSLFGFGNASDTNATSTCGHYWECNRNQSRYFAGKQGYHDWKAQWRLLSLWISQREGTDHQLAFYAGGAANFFARNEATRA